MTKKEKPLLGLILLQDENSPSHLVKEGEKTPSPLF
jgi:hypothetical protein